MSIIIIFFVVDQILEDKFSITDINMEFDFMSLEEFDRIWDGYVLIVSPKQEEKSENQPNIWVESIRLRFWGCRFRSGDRKEFHG